MKKFFLICLSVISCCGCSLPPKQQLETSEVELTTIGYMRYIEYDGHEYLIWGSKDYQGGICHSPKCPCRNNK